jgi:hypothetical protein
LRIKELNPLGCSVDTSANRLSCSIVLGSLIVGVAIIYNNSNTQQLYLISVALFVVASLLVMWLLISILRSGRLK